MFEFVYIYIFQNFAMGVCVWFFLFSRAFLSIFIFISYMLLWLWLLLLLSLLLPLIVYRDKIKCINYTCNNWACKSAVQCFHCIVFYGEEDDEKKILISLLDNNLFMALKLITMVCNTVE